MEKVKNEVYSISNNKINPKPKETSTAEKNTTISPPLYLTFGTQLYPPTLDDNQTVTLSSASWSLSF